MTIMMRRYLALLALPLLLPLCTPTQESAAKPPDPDKLRLSGLRTAKLLPNQCLLKYRVTTTPPECQAFIDQGLGYFYSYVWMEAARSFETAAQKDPECAMAWWCLSRALERYGKGG